MKKRMLAGILSAMMVFSTAVSLADTTYEDEKSVGLIVNEEWVSDAQPPILRNGRTLAPLRVISEKLGFKVDWDGNEKKVTVSDSDKLLELFIDKNYIINNGTREEMDVAPIIHFDTTMVPLRKIAELLGCDVEWSGISYVAMVNSPAAFDRYSKLSPENPVYTNNDKSLSGHIEKVTYKSEITAMSLDKYELILEQLSDFEVPSEHSGSGKMTYKNVKRVEIISEDSSVLDKFIGKYVTVEGNIMESPANGYASTEVRIYMNDLK